MSSIKRKLNVNSLGEKYKALRDLEKSTQTKTSVKNMMYPFVKPSSIEITNAYFAELVSFLRSWKRYARAFAKIRILHVHSTARKQSSILTYFNRKRNTNYCKNIDIFSLSYCL